MDSYKIFKQLEEREKRTNPYKFYDKDELIDEILKLEDKIEEVREYIEKHIEEEYKYDGLLYENKQKKELLEILGKGSDKE